LLDCRLEVMGRKEVACWTEGVSQGVRSRDILEAPNAIQCCQAPGGGSRGTGKLSVQEEACACIRLVPLFCPAEKGVPEKCVEGKE
jgi:hypothetical protein